MMNDNRSKRKNPESSRLPTDLAALCVCVVTYSTKSWKKLDVCVSLICYHVLADARLLFTFV